MQKVFSIIVCTILGLATLFFGGTTLYYRNELGKSVSELRYIREKYERAADIQRNIEDTVRDANSTIQRQHDSLCVSVSTLGELRRSFEEVEQYCHSLENYINSINSEFSGNNNDTDNSAVQQIKEK